MKMLIRAMIFVMALVSFSKVAYGGWESALCVGQESTGDGLINRCKYLTGKGYQFSINNRGVCPQSVEVNPETGSVKAPNAGYGSPRSNFGNKWESAFCIRQEPTGDGLLNRCIYKTVGGYQFSINKRGVCAQSVEVNPETGNVKSSNENTGYSSPPNSIGGRWERAFCIGQEATDDWSLSRCNYETTGGYRFSTIQKGICSQSVEVNAETRQVR